jgi:hypothetical protein
MFMTVRRHAPMPHSTVQLGLLMMHVLEHDRVCQCLDTLRFQIRAVLVQGAVKI